MQRVFNTFSLLYNDSPRRLHLWLGMVATVIALLTLNALMPQGMWANAELVHVLPRAAILVFLVALTCEYLDSSLGMGYGTTLTPILLLAGFAPLDIVPAILLSEALTGAAAGLLHQRDGNVNFLRDVRARRTALLLIALSAAGAIAAAMLAVRISKTTLTLFIATIIIAMGIVILVTLNRPFRYRPAGIVAIGAVAAFNKGLSGGGYGPLVTAGQVVSGLPSKHAIAITSVAESFTCVDRPDRLSRARPPDQLGPDHPAGRRRAALRPDRHPHRASPAREGHAPDRRPGHAGTGRAVAVGGVQVAAEPQR